MRKLLIVLSLLLPNLLSDPTSEASEDRPSGSSVYDEDDLSVKAEERAYGSPSISEDDHLSEEREDGSDNQLSAESEGQSSLPNTRVSHPYSSDYSESSEFSFDYSNDVDLMQKLVVRGRFKEASNFLSVKFFHHHNSNLFASFPEDPELAGEFMDILRENGLFDFLTVQDLNNSCQALIAEFGRNIEFLHHIMEDMDVDTYSNMCEHVDDKHVPLIPIKFVQRHPEDFVRGFGCLNLYSPEQIRFVTNIVACCKVIAANEYPLVDSRAKWEAINPMCLKYAKDLSEQDLSLHLHVGIIPGNMFSYYTGEFSDRTFQCLTAKHLSYYGSEAKRRTSPVDLNLIAPLAAPGVSPSMFNQFIARQSKEGEPIVLKGIWKHLPDNVFSEFRDPEDFANLASKISGECYQEMKKSQIAAILKHPEACASIRGDAEIPKHRIEELGISSKCFAAMNAQLKMKIIISGAALPDNILEYVGSQELLKMEFSIFSLNRVKGKNMVKIIENLSSKIDDKQSHACRLIKTPENFRDMRIFRRAIPKNCWKFMTMKIKAKNVLKNPTLFAGRPKILKTLLENDKGVASNLNKVEKRGIQKLTAGRAGRECRYMTKPMFDDLSGDFRSGLSSTCIASLPFLSSLDEEEMLHFVPDAFSHIDEKLAKNLRFENLTNRHLEHLSEAIGFTRTAGSSLTRTVLENQIKPNRLSHLPARVWGTVPPSSFAIFNDPSILSRIPGEKMVYWTKDQVAMIPRNVLTGLDREQATLIGSLSGEKTAMIKHLMGIVPKKNMMVRTVLGERIKGQSSSASSSARSTVCSAVFTGLMTAALFL